MPREQFTIQPPARFDEAAFKGFHREVNLRLHRISELFDAVEKKPKFAGDLDVGTKRVTNIATAVADDDAVPLHQLRVEVQNILKAELAAQTSEADADTLAGGDDEASGGGGGGGDGGEDAQAALESAVPTLAPPNVAFKSAVGTTDGSTGDILFALSDHTHGELVIARPIAFDGLDGEDSWIPGPPGVAGAAGAPGATGATGATGPMGAPGMDGEDGADGDLGPPGPTGATGAAGATGATGAQGVQGFPGLDGIDGEDSLIPGPVGLAGAAGATGATGAAGAAGAMGPPGFVLDDRIDDFLPFIGHDPGGTRYSEVAPGDNILRLRTDLGAAPLLVSTSAIIGFPGSGQTLTIGLNGVGVDLLSTQGTIEFITTTPGNINILSNAWQFFIDTAGAQYPGVTLFSNAPSFVIDTAAINGVGVAAYPATIRNTPTYKTQNGGTFATHTDYTILDNLILQGSISLFSKFGFRVNVPSTSGGASLDNYYGFYLEDFSTNLDNFSYFSEGSNHLFHHGGYMRVGNALLGVGAVAGVTLDVFSGDVQLRTGNAVRWRPPAGANYFALRAAVGGMAGITLYDWPDAFPLVSGQALVSTTTGVMSWASIGTTAAAVTPPVFFPEDGDLDAAPFVPRNLSTILADFAAIADPFTQYLLLAGRTTTGNNFALTTSVGGTGIGAGGTDAGAIFRLRSSTSASAHTGYLNLDDATRLMDTAFTNTTTNFNLFDVATNGITQNVNSSLRIFNLSSTITVDSDMVGFLYFRGAPTFQPPAGESHALGQHTGFSFAPSYTPVASQSLTGLTLRGLSVGDVYTNAGTLNTITARYAVDSAGTMNTNWTATDWALAHMTDPIGTGGTITRLGFAEIDDLTVRGVGAVYSVWSKGASVPLCHGGKAIFGVSQSTLTAPSATVDIGGDLATRQQTVNLANGVNSDITRTGTFIRCTGGGASATITGFTAGADGIWIVVFNDTGAGITLTNNATSVAANQLLVAGGSRTLADQRSAIFLYETAASRWQEIRPA